VRAYPGCPGKKAIVVVVVVVAPAATVKVNDVVDAVFAAYRTCNLQQFQSDWC